jgi:hypothetical protein
MIVNGQNGQLSVDPSVTPNSLTAAIAVGERSAVCIEIERGEQEQSPACSRRNFKKCRPSYALAHN